MAVHVGLGVDLSTIKVRLQVVQLVRVRLLRQDRRAVVVRERRLDGVGVVQEVEHEHVVLLGVRPVEARQGLHGLDAREDLVHIHRVQEWLVVPGLELVGADQEAIRVLGDPVGDHPAGEPVQRRLGHLDAAVLMLAGERDDGLVRALAFDQVVADGVVVRDGAVHTAGDHHRPGLAADLVEGEHLVVEVIDHDLGLEPDGVLVALDVPAQLLLGPLGVELRVALDLLGQLVVARDRRVDLEYVEDEALLDGLLHRVAVEGPVLDDPAHLERLAEDLEGLVLGRRGEREVARVGQQLA